MENCILRLRPLYAICSRHAAQDFHAAPRSSRRLLSVLHGRDPHFSVMSVMYASSRAGIPPNYPVSARGRVRRGQCACLVRPPAATRAAASRWAPRCRRSEAVVAPVLAAAAVVLVAASLAPRAAPSSLR